jgi:hypothetical protein
MDNTETKLQEQEAPLKNTDNAFVKVNKDGSPGMDADTSDNAATKDKTTPISEGNKER